MKVLVTGSSGFVGRRVCLRLSSEGLIVRGADLQSRESDPWITSHVDVTDYGVMENLIGEFLPEAIIHLAGVADARSVAIDPISGVSINVIGTANVLAAAASCKVSHVAVASSSWIDQAAGASDAVSPVHLDTGHFYTSTMVAKEMLVHDFHRDHQLRCSIFRYSPLYGPGMWKGLAVRSFIEAARSGGPLVVHGDGSQGRRFLFVDDLADAFLRVIYADVSLETFQIRGPRLVTVKNLANEVAALFNGVQVIYAPLDPNRGLSWSELAPTERDQEIVMRLLGWKPTTDLRNGLEKTVADLSEAGALQI